MVIAGNIDSDSNNLDISDAHPMILLSAKTPKIDRHRPIIPMLGRWAIIHQQYQLKQRILNQH